MEMEAFEYQWTSADGIPLLGRGWTPEKPKAVICHVHGLGEHSGRYAHVAKALGAGSYAFMSFDQRGFGRSGGPRGHSPSIDAYLDDIDSLLLRASERWPGLPRLIYGHSLGGLFVLCHAIRRRPQVRGVIATASALATALEQQKAKVAMARVLGTLLPGITIDSGMDPRTISRDPAVVERYMADPLVHGKMSFGMGKAVLAASAWVKEHAREFPHPLLLMHGSADTLGFASGSTAFAAKVPRACTLKIWDGLSHELHNEPEKAQVFAFLLSWLDARLAEA